ncbi:MAG: hypothetical protein KDD56_05985 [Bdellovibrionales bacterium]|nr:hypothetical protein [Bdellovibrionales bacterium]
MANNSLSESSFGEELGFAFKSLIVGLCFIVVTVAVLLYIFGDVVRPGFVGIRQITFGPGQGFSQSGLPPGYHWTVPFYSRIHMVPQTVQVLHFHREKSKYPNSAGSLEVQTTDGATVDVDVSVLTRIYDKPSKDHGGPADLIKNIGIVAEVWRNHVRRVSDDELRRSLGKLSTGQFYNPFSREKQVEEAKQNIGSRLAEYGISIQEVLIRRYTYRAERIDDAIFSKNLQDQEERLNATKSGLAEVKAELEQVAAEWDAKIRTLNVEGENKAHVIRSEGDLYEEEQKATGDLELAKAQAEVERLKANVFSDTAGSDTYLAFKLAPILGSLKGGVVSDIDPYNFEAWLEKLGLSDAKRSAARRVPRGDANAAQ